MEREKGTLCNSKSTGGVEIGSETCQLCELYEGDLGTEQIGCGYKTPQKISYPPEPVPMDSPMPRREKHVALKEAVQELGGIPKSVEALCRRLRADLNPERVPSAAMPPAKPEPVSFVQVLNSSPDQIRKTIAETNQLLTDLESLLF